VHPQAEQDVNFEEIFAGRGHLKSESGCSMYIEDDE